MVSTKVGLKDYWNKRVQAINAWGAYINERGASQPIVAEVVSGQPLTKDVAQALLSAVQYSAYDTDVRAYTLGERNKLQTFVNWIKRGLSGLCYSFSMPDDLLTAFLPPNVTYYLNLTAFVNSIPSLFPIISFSITPTFSSGSSWTASYSVKDGEISGTTNSLYGLAGKYMLLGSTIPVSVNITLRVSYVES